MKVGQSLTGVPLPIMILLWCTRLCWSQTYNDKKNLFDDKLNSSVYNPEIQPLNNQSRIIDILGGFELLTIVRVDDVSQSFICNGFVGLFWTDERLAWNPADYGGVTKIHPKTSSIWRPRLILINTLGDRDLFKDDHAPMTVTYDGTVSWIPGGLFPATCKLDLTKYPFDEQSCSITLFSMSLRDDELAFHALTSTVGSNFYVSSGEWDLSNSLVTAGAEVVDGQQIPLFTMTFHIKRLPTFLVLNIILPVLFLSFLNILVFVIPSESGEKISYGITVLLALSVFMSIISGLLPRTSDNVPIVTIYLFILLIISTLTVVMSIVIVLLHHMEEKEQQHIKAKENFTNVKRKINILRQAVRPMPSTEPPKMLSTRMPSALAFTDSQPPFSDSKFPETKENSETTPQTERRPNRYKQIGRHINLVSFILFTVVWVAVTMGFMITLSN